MGEPWLQDPDVSLYHGDALETLRQLPDRSVHMCATSPPFYGLRDYGTEGQIGLEETPDQWVDRLVVVFREVRRVLRDDGTLWVEIGDSYASAPVGSFNGGGFKDKSAQDGTRDMSGVATSGSFDKAKAAGIPAKNLLGQPWLLAFALRADGWYLRSEIIWARPNPMPESVTDRPTKSHSTVFLLSKQPRYFYDADAIREPHAEPWRGNGERERNNWSVGGTPESRGSTEMVRQYNPLGANARSVWTIPTEPTPFAHFATWPQALVRRMILAGTSERGCCPECGAPWVRQTDITYEHVATGNANGVRKGDATGTMAWRGQEVKKAKRTETLGWSPSCAHDAPPAPCTVLDPFAGSGTTCLVARNHGRRSIGIELNEAYLKIAGQRLAQLSLLALEPEPVRLFDD
jgi:DNA modification methylase